MCLLFAYLSHHLCVLASRTSGLILHGVRECRVVIINFVRDGLSRRADDLDAMFFHAVVSIEDRCYESSGVDLNLF